MKRETGDGNPKRGTGIAQQVEAVSERFTIPQHSEGFLQRQRLLDRLELGVAGPLTLVSAPAGTGKTVLVSHWARRAQVRGSVAWVTLDGHDESRTRFWWSLAEGLGRCGVVVRLPAAQTDPQDVGRGYVDALMLALLERAELEHPEPVVVVLDCEADISPEVAEDLECALHGSGGCCAWWSPPGWIPPFRCTATDSPVASLRFGKLILLSRGTRRESS